MTRDAILDELFSLLNEEPQNKGNVVHVLIQIRKLLEHRGKSDGYWALNFFCDWIAHTRLTRGGARKILKILDDRLPTFDARNPEGIDPDGMVMSILSLDLLRRDLRGFLQVTDLPTRWVDDDFTWQAVVRFYGQQVLDIPLMVDDEKFLLEHIRRIEIVGFEPASDFVETNPGETFFGLQWVVTLNSGQKFLWPYTSNVMAKPADWLTQGIRKDRKSSSGP
jgi:hypothetical protein